MPNSHPQNSDIIVYLAHLDDFNEASLMADERIPNWVKRQAQTLADKRKIQFLACRLLLSHILRDHYQFDGLPNIEISANGRPQFMDKQAPDFNISHSQSAIAVAVCRYGRIGLDIEWHRQRKNIDKVTDNFFSPSESLWLHQQSDQLTAFWLLWTVRESALKLYAKGVWQMRQLTVIPEPLSVSADFAPQIYTIYRRFDDIHLSISSNLKIAQVKVIRF
ncbi:4'-phosphopantetheinyl transferase superfamily protein [Utexia brackfieldae]|uniref:4'-phosphopantetheinyl transferase family protein n=1 Tax=Utexia brackfieldae TaxID=3074108 RepID=UPI00370D491E